MEILRFSTHGRVFAYRVTVQFMGIGKKNARAHLGSEMMLTFYDEEGSGLFTIMQYPGSDLIPRLAVPEWVKTIPK